MRKSLIASTVLLSAALTVTGCMERTGDLGNKNIRPQNVKNYNMDGNRMKNMRFANDQRNEMNRVDGARRENNNIVGAHGNSHMKLSEKVADKLAALPDVDAAYVMLTDRNAYVAITQNRKGMTQMSSGDDLADGLKNKIANQVKSMSPTTQNVYVSANPDFTSRMKGFAEDVRSGHPIQGFITEFNALAERIFPEKSGISGHSTMR